MASIVRPHFHTSIAEAVYSEIVSRMSRYYYGAGYILPWPDENSPTTPVNNYEYELSVRNELISLNSILAGEVAFVIPRIDWTSNTIYDQYDDTYSASNPASSGATSLKEAQFYVLTDEFNVYKCISNNYNAKSVNKPTSTGSSIVETADGYQWKYMYTIPLASRNRFLNPQFMPVSRSVENGFYSNGAITDVVISNPGSGYVDGDTTLVITGDGENAEVTLSIDGAGQIDSATIVNPGSGYTNVLTTVNGAGSNGEVTLIVSEGDLNTQQANVELLAIAGAIHKIEVESQGLSYTNPTVTINGDGSGAAANAIVEDGKIVDIVMTNVGVNYTRATVVITDGGGTGASARAIISPIGGHGKDAVNELFSDVLCFNVTLGNTEYNNIPVNNDNRQLCILKDIKSYGSDLNFINVNGTTAFTLNGSFNASEHNADDIITSGNKTFYIVSVIDNSMLVIAKDDSVPANGETYTNQTTSNTFSVVSSINPDINKFSGKVLFVDNRVSFVQSEAQFVNFKTFIRF